jgi:hypothetical protein
VIEPVWRYSQDARTTTLRVEYPQTPQYRAFSVEVQHDEFGRVTQIQDYNGVSSAGYDDLNRLVNWNPAVGRGVTYSFARDLGLQRWITNVNLSGIGVYQLGEDPESLRGRREGPDGAGPEPVRPDGDDALRPRREAGPGGPGERDVQPLFVRQPRLAGGDRAQAGERRGAGHVPVPLHFVQGDPTGDLRREIDSGGRVHEFF